MLLLGREEEVLQELRRGELLAASHGDDLGDVAGHVDDLHLRVKLQALLRVIAEAYRLADVEAATVGAYLPHEELEERALARTIIADNAELLVTRKDVGELVKDAAVAKAERELVGLEDFAAYIG